MQHLGFTLCSRCKKAGNTTGQTIAIGNRVCGFVCNGCISPMVELVEAELTRVPIPEALKPYLSVSTER